VGEATQEEEEAKEGESQGWGGKEKA